MILSIVAILVLALLAMAPGWLLVRRHVERPGIVSAAMAASLTVVMLVTALTGIIAEALLGVPVPVLAFPVVAILATGAALAFHRSDTHVSAPLEWQGLALGAVFLIYSFFVHLIAVVEGPDGSLLVHGWYNADWFKHLGHVSAIANYGVPAVDNFNQADTLHYYWLSYILPAAGTAIGNDGWAALAATNSIVVLLFGSVLYGLIRYAGANRSIALGIGIIGIFASAPVSTLYQLLFGIGLEQILSYTAAPKGPALLTLLPYTPQHLLALTLLVSWFLLRDHKAARWLALAALASAMTISVLLGAVLLIAYGFCRLWTGRARAIPELTLMVVLSGLTVVVLQVIQIGNIDSSIESPLLTNDVVDLPLSDRIASSLRLVVSTVGIPFLVTIFGLYFWRPTDEQQREAKAFALSMIAATLIAAAAAEVLMTERLAIEMRIRVVSLPAIANAMMGAVLVQLAWNAGTRERVFAITAVIAVIAVALPSAALRTAWHGRTGDHFTTAISHDDRIMLDTLRTHTDARAIVLQYPEAPVLAPKRGDDAWAAILGQRAVTANLRATDYPAAVPRLAAAASFFAGKTEAIADEIDVIYLSRALHPDTFDTLVLQVDANPEFTRVACEPDACLFQRHESDSTQ